MAHSLKKELIDQAAHFGAAILFVGPLLAFPCWLSAMWAGFGYGFVREVSQASPNINLAAIKEVLGGPNHRLDMGFWSLGALAAWLLLS
jgi:hypothetical protein